MSEIIIYLSGENRPEAQTIQIEENASIKEIIVKHVELSGNKESIEELEIFIEDEDEVCRQDNPIKHHRVHDQGRVHCHRCKHIRVELEYNGVTKPISVRPSTTGEKILSLVPSVFPDITPMNAANLLLEISKDHYVSKTDHIGIFVSYPACHIKVKLTPKKNILG